MTQASLGTIDPNTTSGTELAALLTAFGQAVESTHLGAARPSYVREGMTWLRVDSSNQLSWMLYDGDADVLLGVINKSANTISLTVPPVTLAGLGGVPTSRALTGSLSIAGGGNLSANRAFTLVNDNASPGASRYYGTGSSGDKGWFALPTPPKAVPELAAYGTPGTYSFGVPAGVTRLRATVIGACGGNYSNDDVMTAGGAGGVAFGYVPVVPGATVSIIVGAAGVGGSSPTDGGGSTLAAVGGSLYAAGGTAAGGFANGSPGAAFGSLGAGFLPYIPGFRTTSSRIGEAGAGTHGLVVLEWWT